MYAEFDNDAGLYAPKHRITDPIVQPIRIVTDQLPTPDPLLVQRKDGVTLLVEQHGTPAEDIIPKFLSDMTIPEQRFFFQHIWGIDAPPEAIAANWRKHLAHLLWMRCLPHLIPRQVRWE